MSARREIRALAMGARVKACCQREVTARVLSVHQRVINLEAGDELLALALPQVGGSSRFLCLNMLPDLSCGDFVQFSQKAIDMGKNHVELTDVPLWQGPLPAATHASLTSECLVQFEQAIRTLNIHPGADAACSISPQTAKRWIGLGPGLTPAGDDILLGYIAMDNHLGSDVAHSWAMHTAVNQNLTQTTTLSAHLLHSALKGDYHEYVGRVLAICCGLSSENLLTALRRLSRVGASSGESIIYGMWLALQHIAGPASADVIEWRPQTTALNNGGELCIA